MPRRAIRRITMPTVPSLAFRRLWHAAKNAGHHGFALGRRALNKTTRGVRNSGTAVIRSVLAAGGMGYALERATRTAYRKADHVAQYGLRGMRVAVHDTSAVLKKDARLLEEGVGGAAHYGKVAAVKAAEASTAAARDLEVAAKDTARLATGVESVAVSSGGKFTTLEDTPAPAEPPMDDLTAPTEPKLDDLTAPTEPKLDDLTAPAEPKEAPQEEPKEEPKEEPQEEPKEEPKLDDLTAPTEPKLDDLAALEDSKETPALDDALAPADAKETPLLDTETAEEKREIDDLLKGDENDTPGDKEPVPAVSGLMPLNVPI